MAENKLWQMRRKAACRDKPVRARYAQLLARGPPSAERLPVQTPLSRLGGVKLKLVATFGCCAAFVVGAARAESLFFEGFESGTLGQFQSVDAGAGLGWSASATPFTCSGNFLALVEDPGAVSDHALRTSGSVAVPATGQVTLRFCHFFNWETFQGMGCDGGVLELSVNGGPFVDILAAGGSFSAGGYNGSIASPLCNTNPLYGRQVWTGTNPSNPETVAVLPTSVLGQSLRFQLRAGTDSSSPPPAGQFGWEVDDVSLERTQPTAVTVTSFTAVRAVRGVVLRWNSGSEAGLVGFALQRNGMRLTKRLIAVKGTLAGGRYGFVDTRTVPARLYHYRLQGVRLDGRRTTLGLATVKGQRAR
jgi:hypothetical protein